MLLLADLTDPRRRDEVFGKSVAQLVAFCGNGKLTNASETSREFRELLALAPAAKFGDFVTSCLNDPFPQSGLVLQDVVNEIGRRLGFSVDFGSYTGSQTDAAFDGLWTSPDGWQLIVEVKTTDAYRVKLDRIGEFRRRLVDAGRVTLGRASHLIVVGRDDTGELEAQVRGSKHAWDMRLVSVEALLWLLSIRERLDDEHAVGRITEVLKPEEYTKVDRIIKLVFDTTREAAAPEPEPDPPVRPHPGGAAQVTTPIAEQNALKDLAVAVASRTLGTSFTRTTRSLGVGPKGETIIITYSKLHDSKLPARYWSALHPGPWTKVQSSPSGGLAVACANEGVLVLPREVVEPLISRFWKTERDGVAYSHIVLVPRAGRYVLIGQELEHDVTQYFHPYAERSPPCRIR
jgi:hypothetical protein